MPANHIAEIQDPVCRAKLQGIQDAVFSIDGEMVKLRKSIDEKRGVVAAANMIAERLNVESGALVSKMEAGDITEEELKPRAEQTRYLVQIVREIAAENQNDLLNLRGQLGGLERAVGAAGLRFKAEAQKYERWEREQAEDEQEQTGADSGNGEDTVTGSENEDANSG